MYNLVHSLLLGHVSLHIQTTLNYIVLSLQGVFVTTLKWQGISMKI